MPGGKAFSEDRRLLIDAQRLAMLVQIEGGNPGDAFPRDPKLREITWELREEQCQDEL